MATADEIRGKVTRVLVGALNVDEDEVRLASTLQGDLGAESIDMLDITFRLEREFDMRIPRGELFPESIFQGDPELVHEGRVTEKGMAELRERLPFADLRAFEHDRRLSAVPDLFTVDLLVRYIASKLGQGVGAGQASAAGEQVPTPGVNPPRLVL